MTYNILDLYCGAGGLSVGFERQHGFNILVGLDSWADALETYRHNHPTAGLQTDLSTVPPDEIPVSKNQVDIIIGGPPCKGFSLAGERDPDDERNQLVPRFIDYVEYFEPTVTIMENVVGILSMEDGDVIDYIYNRYESMGYNFDHQVIHANNLGIPQTRSRVFFIGMQTGTPNFPDPRTESETQPVGPVLNRDFEGHYNHNLTNHSDDMVERLSQLEYGESLYDNYSEAWKRIHPDQPAPTIKENHGAPFVHPFEDRVGTPRECAAIQTFPDTYEFKGSKSSVLKQIGNAVPPDMSEYVAIAVKEAILKQLEE
jgi:DNA (cytosine-5)-methyltransferase 1